jgi:Sulfotransferase family
MASAPLRPNMWRPKSRLQAAGVVGSATIEGFRNRRSFREVEYFCLLIGYPHSGSTLMTSLLSAHPEMIIAPETDSLRYVRPGLTRNQLFALILDRDRQFTANERRWNGYDYAIPGSSKAASRLRVIGDKCIGKQARRLHTDPQLLDRVRSVVRVPIRVIHLVRNPFDSIAKMGRRDVPMARRIRGYERLGNAIDEIRSRLSSEELFEIRYETLVTDPKRSLSDAWRFVGLEASDQFLMECTQLIQPSLPRSRLSIDWSDEQQREVEEIIAARPVLAGYTFTSDQ